MSRTVVLAWCAILAHLLFLNPLGHAGGFQCLAEPAAPAPERQQLHALSSGPVPRIRTFRFAVGATAEFTQYHGSKANAYRAVQSIAAHVSAVFERELGVRLQLLPASESLVYENSVTDPFTTNEPGYELLRQAQTMFDTNVGSGNYDVGIVLTRGAFGLAYLRSVGDAARKGSSCLGAPNPDGSLYHANLVAHEVAHQFGANHIFDSVGGICQERRNGWTAFEPGAGSSLMGYAGFDCADDSFVPENDAYFHGENLAEVRAFLNSIPNVGIPGPLISNQAPVIVLPSEYTIPRGTPFYLTASAHDPDGDEISFSWEQIDLGNGRAIGAPDTGVGPLFRSYPPSESATRIFPALPHILSNTANAAEQLPMVGRTLNFQLTARDLGHPGHFSGIATRVHVATNAGPFRVTSHASGGVLSGQTEVRWDVANTEKAPIGVSAVRITLSVDGGASFPITLAASTANDGAEVVQLPAVASANARIRVEAIGNIFFDINDAPLAIGAIQLRIKQCEPASMGMEISWNSSPGKRYRVEVAGRFARAEWTTTDTLVADDTTTAVILPFGPNSRQFIRVVEE